MTGYRVYYQEKDASRRVINHERVDVGASTTQCIIPLIFKATNHYVITVRALSRQLPSPVVGPRTVNLGKTT